MPFLQSWDTKVATCQERRAPFKGTKDATKGRGESKKSFYRERGNGKESKTYRKAKSPLCRMDFSYECFASFVAIYVTLLGRISCGNKCVVLYVTKEAFVLA